MVDFPRTIEDFGDTLSDAEREVIEKTCAGEGCILGDGSRPEGPSEARDVRASVIRYLALGGCEARRTHEKGIQLSGANIIGALDLFGCQNVRMLGLFQCRLEEGCNALNASLSGVYFNGSSVNGLNLEGAIIKDSVLLRNGFAAIGEVSLSGAVVSGQLDCSGSSFTNEGGSALNVQRAVIGGGIFLRNGFSATGEVSLSGAVVSGQLNCIGSSFTNEGSTALNTHGVVIKGDVFLSDSFAAKGEVSLSGAEISGQLNCIRGSFTNHEGFALNAERAVVAGHVLLCEDFSAKGEVRLLGAEISGQLSCTKGSFTNKGDIALNAQGAVIKGGLFWRGVTVAAGQVSLIRARTAFLNDDLTSWPVTGLLMDGFQYETILGADLDVQRRLDWLAKNNSEGADFEPQPYQQLAKVYGDMGHRRDRGAVLMEMETRLREWQVSRMWKNDYTPWGAIKVSFYWFFGHMLRLMVGYGNRPARSLIWAIGLIGLTWLFAFAAWTDGDFAPASPHVLVSEDWQRYAKPVEKGGALNPAEVWSDASSEGRDYETFQSLAYAADVFIPLVNFGQEDAWAPSTTRGWWGRHLWWLKWIVKGLGWIVTAMGAAAITGVIRND